MKVHIISYDRDFLPHCGARTREENSLIIALMPETLIEFTPKSKRCVKCLREAKARKRKESNQ